MQNRRAIRSVYLNPVQKTIVRDQLVQDLVEIVARLIARETQVRLSFRIFSQESSLRCVVQ